MKITLISDTHTRHHEITQDLPGGDLLLHSGDLMNSGYNQQDIHSFLNWFSMQPYTHKVFIAGNHDRMFQNDPDFIKTLISHSYKDSVIYLEDSEIVIDGIKIYGSPWQPWFYDWAFNLPKNGPGLAAKWEAIPKDTDILLTHGPAYGTLDTVAGRPNDWLGCELLAQRIHQIQPKIHVCGHIHSGYGYVFKDNTHFFNASVLDEQYEYTQPPQTIEWDKETNEVKFLS